MGWTVHPEAKVCLLGKAGWGTFSVLSTLRRGLTGDSLTFVHTAQRLLSKLKILCPPFRKSQWQENTQITCKNRMIVVATPNGSRGWRSTRTHARMHHIHTHTHWHPTIMSTSTTQSKQNSKNIMYIYWIIHSKNAPIKKKRKIYWHEQLVMIQEIKQYVIWTDSQAPVTQLFICHWKTSYQ